MPEQISMQSPTNSSTKKTQKRLVFTPPFNKQDFFPGEFVYDPAAPWSTLRSGMLVLQEQRFELLYMPQNPGESIESLNLNVQKSPFALNILADSSRRGNKNLNAEPWLAIARAVVTVLRNTKNYQIRLEILIDKLKTNKNLDRDLIEDTLRMMASNGDTKVVTLKNSIEYKLSNRVLEYYNRLTYLRSFSNDILANSQRINTLIGHGGTVGSYREDLLRNMLRKLMPTRYSVDTGFIEDSPRQLDVIIWDTLNYAPLFREGNVVVVPRSAVRGVIEVKTTLTSKTISEAFDILHDVFQLNPDIVPVFKGVFAFDTKYKTNLSLAKRIKSLYSTKNEYGLEKYWHKHLYSGLTAICVPSNNCVMQSYDTSKQKDKFPQPYLIGLHTEGESGDWHTARFLQSLLEHLDQQVEAKHVSVSGFYSNKFGLKLDKLVYLFDDWKVTQVPGHLEKLLTPSGARAHFHALQRFFSGELSSFGVEYESLNGDAGV